MLERLLGYRVFADDHCIIDADAGRQDSLDQGNHGDAVVRECLA
jgi:hypothetical protein